MDLLREKMRLLPLSGPMDSGGGGGGSPTQTQTTTAELPEWARPYAKDVLVRGQALTDVSQNPYQVYGQPRIAGFSPLQQQAQAGAAALGPTQQTAQASDIASAAGLGALGTQYQAGRFSGGMFSPYAAQAYMSPYIESALAPQMELLNRQYGQQAAQNAAQATQAGAFGGSRYGIQQAQNQLNQNLATQNLLGQGYNTAYQQAQQQFNADMARRLQAQQLGEQSRQFGANLGLQGLQTGLQAAGTLGTLGQQQLAQQQAAIQAQATAGQQQQALQQKSLDTAYQDYLTQLNYPYQQLSYMSNLVRGTPMGMSTTSQVYQPGPTGVQTLGALGLGAYGLSKMMAEGGEVSGYAGGGMVSFDDGGSVGGGLGIINKFNDQGAMASSMYNLSDAQLQDILQHPTTQAEAVAAQQELNRRQEAMMASERQGMAGAYNQLPYSTQERMVRAAGGGILAFKAPTAANNYSSVEDPDADTSAEDAAEDQLYSPGISANSLPVQLWRQSVGQMMADKGYTPMTASQRDAAELASFKRMQAMGGVDPYGPMAQTLKQQDTDRLAALEQGKGLAALAAIPAILQPGGTIRGIGAAGAAFGGAYGQALQADRAEKRYLGQMQFHLADAKRKENMGLYREARQDVRDAETAGLGAARARTEKLKGVASSSAAMARAMRPTGGSGAKGPKEFEFAVQQYLPEVQAMYPDIPKERQPAKAFQIYQERKNAGLAGVTTRTEATAEEKARERAAKRAVTDPGVNEALRKRDSAAADARRRVILQEEMDKPEPKAGTVKPIKLD